MIAWQWVIAVPLMGVWGYMVGRWSRQKDLILCTPEQVVEAVARQVDYLKRVGRQYGMDVTLDDVDWEESAKSIAANLIQLTQRGR